MKLVSIQVEVLGGTFVLPNAVPITFYNTNFAGKKAPLNARVTVGMNKKDVHEVKEGEEFPKIEED